MRFSVSLLIYCFIFISCFSQERPKYDNYKKVEITEGLYFAGDLGDVVKADEHLYLYYVTDSLDDFSFITDYIYVLEDDKGQESAVGGFNMNVGFFGSDNEALKLERRAAKPDSWKKNLKGIAMDLLEEPFVISGVALNDKGKLYQTEVMELFCINPEAMTIEEWFPKWY
ncbi:MAG: hypothetical protein IJU95_01110 [Treponema sp.]|nr:hypothetical protein [Treponema sp.]